MKIISSALFLLTLTTQRCLAETEFGRPTDQDALDFEEYVQYRVFCVGCC